MITSFFLSYFEVYDNYLFRINNFKKYVYTFSLYFLIVWNVQYIGTIKRHELF